MPVLTLDRRDPANQTPVANGRRHSDPTRPPFSARFRAVLSAPPRPRPFRPVR
jgi:hypothetical protein